MANNTFSREDTRVMKGFAIILMLMHHLWAFPDRIAGGELLHVLTLCDESSLLYFGTFGKICVSIFFFLGGYGAYISSQKKPYDMMARIKKLYLSYWKVFVIFIPIAFLFFANQPVYCEDTEICTRYADFSLETGIDNFLGFSTSYNSEWWFLKSYVCALITYPVIRRLIDKHSTLCNVWGAITASILMETVMPAIGEIEALGTLNNNFLYDTFFCQSGSYTACFWMGCILAKDGQLMRLHTMMKTDRLLTPVTDVLLIAAIIHLRTTLTASTPDIIYVPFLIVALQDLLRYLRPLRWVLLQIGRESTNMWLIHSFFCYYFYPTAKLIAAPRWGVLSLLLLIVMSYAAARLVTLFWKMIASGKKQLC